MNFGFDYKLDFVNRLCYIPDCALIPFYRVTILRGAGLKKFFQPRQAAGLKYQILIQGLIVFK